MLAAWVAALERLGEVLPPEEFRAFQDHMIAYYAGGSPERSPLVEQAAKHGSEDEEAMRRWKYFLTLWEARAKL